MKRSTKALLAATLATMVSTAVADDLPFPSSAQEFPPISTGDSYARRHANDAVNQASVPFPSSANETTALASEFQSIETYADRHRDDAVNQASASFPSSANETTSFASEFPGMETYADRQGNNDIRQASPALPSSADETGSVAGESLTPAWLVGGTSAAGGEGAADNSSAN